MMQKNNKVCLFPSEFVKYCHIRVRKDSQQEYFVKLEQRDITRLETLPL